MHHLWCVRPHLIITVSEKCYLQPKLRKCYQSHFQTNVEGEQFSLKPVIKGLFNSIFVGKCKVMAREAIMLTLSPFSSSSQQVLGLYIQLFESDQSELEILMQLEMRKMLLDRMVCLLSRGCVLPVVKYIRTCWQKSDTDISLIRYFVTEVLDMMAPPYSADFVQLFLPMVEDEDITGSMRGGGGGDDLVSQFIGHCRTRTADA